jgi:hypothetical protein
MTTGDEGRFDDIQGELDHQNAVMEKGQKILDLFYELRVLVENGRFHPDMDYRKAIRSCTLFEEAMGLRSGDHGSPDDEDDDTEG